MPLYPIFFILVFVAGSIAAITRGPIWGLLLYIYIYFNIPAFHWWGQFVPDLRWSFMAAGVLLVSCVVHSKQLLSHKDSLNVPFTILVLLLVLMTAIIPISYNSDVSIKRLYDFSRYVIIFYLLGRIITDFEKYQQYILTLIICATYLFWNIQSSFHGGRLEGVGLPDAFDANSFAAVPIMILPIMGAVALTGKTWQKVIAIIGIPLALNVFILTRSRGAFVGLLMQLIVALILFRKSKYRKKIIAGVACVIILFSVLIDDLFKSRLLELVDNVSQGKSANVSVGRVSIWEYSFNMVRDHPLGIGGGGFQILSPQYLPFELLDANVGERAAHNTYLLVLAEEGWIGLALYLLFIFFTMHKAFKILATKNMAVSESEQKVISFHATMLIMSLSGFWAAAFFGDRVYFEGVFLVAAMTPVLLRISRQAPSPKNIDKSTNSTIGTNL